MLYCDHLWLLVDARGPQGVEGGNGTVVGTGIYDLLPHLGNDININFNVAGPRDAAAYHPTAVSIDGSECLLLN